MNVINPSRLRHQADAILIQAAAVQNTWYTVLAAQTRVARVYLISLVIGTANETLEISVTVDGVTLAGALNATFGTVYRIEFNYGITAESLVIGTTRDSTYIIEGSNVSVAVRKTTNAGAGTLSSIVKYALRY